GSCMSKRLGPALGDDQNGFCGRAQTPKRGQPNLGHAIDWQHQQRHAGLGDDDRTPGAEFGDPALDRHMPGLAEQASVAADVMTHTTPLILAVTHGPSHSPCWCKPSDIRLWSL